jgi:hypothetical protein
MTSTRNPGDYRLLLRPLQDGCPPAVRLKRLLKVALRVFALCCVEAVELDQEEKGDDADSDAPEPANNNDAGAVGEGERVVM